MVDYNKINYQFRKSVIFEVIERLFLSLKTIKIFTVVVLKLHFLFEVKWVVSNGGKSSVFLLRVKNIRFKTLYRSS